MSPSDDPGREDSPDWPAAAVEDELDEWQASEFDQAYAGLGPGAYLLIRPSEEQEVVSGLPEPGRGQRWLAFRPGEIVLTDGRRRDSCAAGGGWGAPDISSPRAARLVLVTVEGRRRRWSSGPRRYLIAASAEGELLAWIDHSPPSWDFRPGQVAQIARLAGLETAVERYRSEDELSAAHPGWLG